jgi:hypothetical protein
MSGEGFLVWHMVWFWSLVCVGLASASITVESLTCEGKNGKCAKPRCMAKESTRDEWGRSSSVVGFIYLVM